MVDQTFINYFSNADVVVKSVMILLFAASIFSWTLIIQRFAWLGTLRSKTAKFCNQFRDINDIGSLFHDVNKKKSHEGAESIFVAGYKEYARGTKLNLTHDTLAQSTERAMMIAGNEALADAEQNLNILATIGSTSPYIGLFGTVWGIMNAFHALGTVQQATIAMVAPGISEALIATAMGLFAAIPAVIAFNRLSGHVDRLAVSWDNFQAEFSILVNRQNQVVIT